MDIKAKKEPCCNKTLNGKMRNMQILLIYLSGIFMGLAMGTLNMMYAYIVILLVIAYIAIYFKHRLDLLEINKISQRTNKDRYEHKEL